MGAQTSQAPLPDVDISWYRTPIDPAISLKLHQVSDLRASLALRQPGALATLT